MDLVRPYMEYTAGYMQLIHALNRGVDGRDLFMDDLDRVRFVHNLYEFNDSAPANPNLGYFFRSKSMDLVRPYMHRARERLVDIHGWVLMKNHYHLLLSELAEGGITAFLRKLNTGFAKYFNERHGRIGTLFQSRTKKVAIERDAHFLYILHYIHLNPLDYLKGAEGWRVRDTGTVANRADALAHLDRYRWSSYLDYAGAKNFPSILTTSFLKEALGDPHEALRQYLAEAEQEDNLLNKLTLE